jgi:hypothetical protein
MTTSCKWNIPKNPMYTLEEGEPPWLSGKVVKMRK